MENSDPPPCTKPSCFFCAMAEQDKTKRRQNLVHCFKQLPLKDDQDHVLVLSGLWSMAMSHPKDPEFPSLGIFHSMTKLIQKSLNNPNWLSKDQNIYIPYYAAHIIGSYTKKNPHFAEIAVKSGAVPVLLELMRGDKMSWVEQRAAVRAIGHIASHESTFEAVAAHGDEITELAMEISCNCVEAVYKKFVGVKRRRRLKYHRNLLTRGHERVELENKKAEEWASELQCWSLYILNCFARKEKSLERISSEDFMKKLCRMWSGLVNRNSPGGIGLIRTLCQAKIGRERVSKSKIVMKFLGNIARSSDDWSFMAIDCFIMLLKDNEVRKRVIEIAAMYLVDLIETRSKGEEITRLMLRDYHKVRFWDLKLKNKKAEEALGEIWDLKVERRKKEKLMSEQELEEREIMVGILKQEGNKEFWSGKIEKAVRTYSEALDLCLLKMRKEKIVLYSNRAQCFLLLKNPVNAVSDATRALCLSGGARVHCKSLWRRSQAYDMMGLTRESLMDCLMFINCRRKFEARKGMKIPYYAERMVVKQMNATWLFGTAKIKNSQLGEERNGKFNLQEMVRMMRKRNNSKDRLCQVEGDVRANFHESRLILARGWWLSMAKHYFDNILNRKWELQIDPKLF